MLSYIIFRQNFTKDKKGGESYMTNEKGITVIVLLVIIVIVFACIFAFKFMTNKSNTESTSTRRIHEKIC